MADILGDLEGLGIEFGKEDFVVEKKGASKESEEFILENKYLKDYLDQKGGKLKCLPLSYIQGNFAYYYSQRNEFLDATLKEVKSLAQNFAKTLDYSSGEDEEFKE